MTNISIWLNVPLKIIVKHLRDTYARTECTFHAARVGVPLNTNCRVQRWNIFETVRKCNARYTCTRRTKSCFCTCIIINKPWDRIHGPNTNVPVSVLRTNRTDAQHQGRRRGECAIILHRPFIGPGKKSVGPSLAGRIRKYLVTWWLWSRRRCLRCCPGRKPFTGDPTGFKTTRENPLCTACERAAFRISKRIPFDYNSIRTIRMQLVNLCGTMRLRNPPPTIKKKK